MSKLYNSKLIQKYIDNNNHHSSNTTTGRVIMKRGNITLEVNESGRLVVSDGWFANWLIIYSHNGLWAGDYIVGNKAIRKRISKIASYAYDNGLIEY